jgi:3-dehydroquinate dehydratase/shikimate dehydrogenase
MICISIAQESRRFALVDMLNAAGQCDMVELRLDRFDKSPDLKELLAHKPKPIIMSCRRPRDGGEWQGSETERLTLLRQCIIDKADYVEIELDIADQIRPFPPAKRVISYTNLQETPADIGEIYNQCRLKNPDVIKLVTLARTPEEAWPLLQIVAQSRVPTVVVGLGKPGVMLTVLGKRVGAPWTYAALERGMETYPGQPTVRDLATIYHYRDVDKTTMFVGVTGFAEQDAATVAVVNAGFAQLDMKTRCLPLAVGSVDLFRKVIGAVKLSAVIVDEPNRSQLLEIAREREPFAEAAQSADLLLRKGDGWSAHNTFGQAAVAAVEETLRPRSMMPDNPLHGRMVMIAGANSLAASVGGAIKQRGGIFMFASRDKEAGHRLAQEYECRYVPFDALYSTTHDVLIVCAEERIPLKKGGTDQAGGIHPGYLKPTITVLDLTAMPRLSGFAKAARARLCPVVQPRQLLLEQIKLQLQLLTGKQVARERLVEALNNALGDEDS